MKNPENEHEELDADTRAIVRAAAELPNLKPTRDLWAGIAARIEAPVVALPVHRERAAPRVAPRVAPSWRRFAIAASLLVVATAGITVSVMKPSASRAGAVASDSVPSPSSVDLPSFVAVAQPVSLQTAEQTFDREIAAMRAVVDARRKELDPATVRVLEKNLKLIDAAISESKAALAKDPASAFLTELLAHAYDTKLQLLRGVASIPSGI